MTANELQVSGSSEFEVRAGRCIVTEALEVYGDLTLSDGAVMTTARAELTIDEAATEQCIRGAGTVWTNLGELAIYCYVPWETPDFMIEDGAQLYTETAVIGSQWGFGDLTVDGAGSKLHASGALTVGLNQSEEEYEEYEDEEPMVMHRLTLNGSQISGGTVDVLQSGVIMGQGQISGTTRSSGMLSPGTKSQGGKIHFTDTYTQFEQGVLSIDLFSAPANGLYDQIDATGAVALAGMLRVNVSGWTPIGTNDFQIVASDASISGTFSQIEVTGISADLVEYIGNGVVRVIGDSKPYDDYLAEFGLSPSDPDCGMDDDYDYDGFSNFDEFIAGTNLKVENEYLLKVLDFSISNISSSSLSFDAVAGRNYPVYMSTNLLTPEPWMLYQIITNEVTGLRTIMVPDEGDFRCYRLDVTLP